GRGGDADVRKAERRFLAEAAVHLVEAKLRLVHQVRRENVCVRQRKVPEASRLARGRSRHCVASEVCLRKRDLLFVVGEEEAPFKSALIRLEVVEVGDELVLVVRTGDAEGRKPLYSTGGIWIRPYC